MQKQIENGNANQNIQGQCSCRLKIEFLIISGMFHPKSIGSFVVHKFKLYIAWLIYSHC